MNFLAPWMGLAGLLAVPVVLMYLARENPSRRIVSTLLFWQGHAGRPHESSRWLRVRRWLSLLLQLVFLGLLVLALVRPVPPWEERLGRPAVYVLDVSSSMGARDLRPDRFAAAAREIGARAGRMPERAALLLTGPRPHVATGWTRSKGAFAGALRDARPGTRACGPRATLELARAIAQDGGAGVHFFTDAVWNGPVPGGLPEGVRTHVFGAPARNAGITHFSVRRNPSAPGEVLVAARVAAGVSADSSGPLRFRLSRDGKLTDVRDLRLEPGGGWGETWAFQAEDGCTFTAGLTGFDGDVLEGDDSAEVSVPDLGTVEAVLVSPPDVFWESALAAIPRVRVTRVWPPDSPLRGDASKLWIFRGVVPPPDFEAAGLVLIQPADSGFFGTLVGDMPAPFITEVADTPVTRFASLAAVGASNATEFRPPGDATIHAASAGRPIIFGRWEGERKWIVFALNPVRSDLVLRAAFPVVLSNLVQGLRGDLSAVFSDPSCSRYATSLRALAPGGDPAATSPPPHPRASHPLWWWLLAAGVCWIFSEWFSYHRRWTE
jgi:hypothetical protein